MRKSKIKTCKCCDCKFETLEKEAFFCSRSCSSTFNNKKRKVKDATKQKIRRALKEKYAKGDFPVVDKTTLSLLVGKTTKGKYRKETPTSILSLSKRTTAKILKRLDVGCSVCGWKEGSCDIHHINGRKIQNCDAHENLCILCPNHHRLAHEKKIAKDTLINFQVMVGERWKEFYYG